MKMKLICIETGKQTSLILNDAAPWENDEIIDSAANRLIKRESEHKHDFVCVSADKLRSEICHALTDLTEHTGEYRSFRIEK